MSEPSSEDDPAALGFSRTARDLVTHTNTSCAWRDWAKVAEDTAEPRQVPAFADKLIAALPALWEAQAGARWIIERCPGSDAARVLRETLERGDSDLTSRPACADQLQRDRDRLAERLGVS